MTRTSRRTVSAALLLVCLLVLAGCGGASKERGQTTKGDDDAPRRVDPDDLDTGSYPTKGSPADETTGTDLANGRAAEAHRIGNVVVDPVDVDPALEVGSNPVGRMASPSEVVRLFASEDPKLVGTRVSGAVATRRVAGEGPGERRSLCIAVMTFDTPAAAAKFTKVIGDGNETSGRDKIFGQPIRGVRITLAGHPQARASLSYVGERDAHPSVSVLRTSGRTVVYMFANGPGSQLATTRAVMAKALTMQLDALEKFEPRRLLELGDVEVDPSGVSGLALPLPALRGKHEPSIPGIWDRNGALHLQTWAGDLGAAFERAGVDVVVQAWSTVYRAKDARKARKLLDEFETAMTEEQYRPFHAPKGLREARCYETVDPEPVGLAPNVCQIQYGRYVAEFGSDTSEKAEQGISAQYLVFQDALGTSDDTEG